MSVQPFSGAISGAGRPGVIPMGGNGTNRARISLRYAYNGMPGRGEDRRSRDSSLIIERYRSEQAALGRQVVQAIRFLWDSNINPEPFSESWPVLYPVLRQIILQHYRASAASAVKFYRGIHFVETRGIATVRPATANVAKLDRVSDSVANGTFYHQLNKQKREPGDASLIARNSMSGAGARFALMGGRDTVILNSLLDAKAMSWERMISPNACSFCTSQAVRGPFTSKMMDFHPHDYCNCVAVPLFRGRESANAGLRDEWQKVTAGRVGAEARAAWEEYRRSNGQDAST